MNEWLIRALEESRARGYLGPGAIGPQIAHAEGFAKCWEERTSTPPASFLDLGSGGGLPGLVLLQRWNGHGVLNDSINKRLEFLREVLQWPDAPQNGEVMAGRAEETARLAEFDSAFDLVTARSFGRPSVTAECAARFLKIGGVLVVSEPPDDDEAGRWSPEGLSDLGLNALSRVRHGAAFQIIQKVVATSIRYPREVGIPRKRPLF